MIRYNIESHAAGFPSKVLATNGGAHIYNIVASEDVDNTFFVGKGAWQSLDLYAEAAPTAVTATVQGKAANGNYYVEIVTADNAYFVYTVPMIEEEYNNAFKKEGNFFNAKGDVMRCYEVKPGDIVEISAAGFKTEPASFPTSVTLQAIAGKTAKQLG